MYAASHSGFFLKGSVVQGAPPATPGQRRTPTACIFDLERFPHPLRISQKRVRISVDCTLLKSDAHGSDAPQRAVKAPPPPRRPPSAARAAVAPRPAQWRGRTPRGTSAAGRWCGSRWPPGPRTAPCAQGQGGQLERGAC